MLIKVALPRPIAPLTYSVPESLQDQLILGSAVLVELRHRKEIAFVVELHVAPEGSYAIKPIHGLAPQHPSLSKEYLQFLQWLSNYYHYPLGEVIDSALPPRPESEVQKVFSVNVDPHSLSEELIKKLKQRGGKRWDFLLWLAEQKSTAAIPIESKATLRSLEKLGLVKQETMPLNFENTAFAAGMKSKPPILQNEQAIALQSIRAALELKKFSCFLLEGVTGSGKTEIYIHAAEQALATGRGVLILVPEISLTPQLLSRFQSRLQVPIAILHSSLSDRERSRQWQYLNEGKIHIALGARSTILAPLTNIGLIIVDEEHEGAFKQEDRLRYNARDAAILRAKLNDAVVVLGSATPSLESYHHVQTGRYSLLRLEKRVTANPLPEVEIIDQRKSKIFGMVSGQLLAEMKSALASHKQSMLLLNRRGYSSYILCESCGFVPQCKNCSVSLTYYNEKRILSCHYCGHEESAPKICKQCSQAKLDFGTLGTEALELNIKEIFPNARILRIDRESFRAKDSLETAFHSVAAGDIDIVIGTQMIAKGHDFPNIGLVGVINADSSINLPDFRAAEKSFQLFTQMAGRAGRGDFSGKVLIQTYQPDHPSIRFSAKHDFRSFAEYELKNRLLFQYPPYYRLARILITDAQESTAQAVAEKITAALTKMLPAGIEILGPAPSLLHRLQNRYRWNILLKAKESTTLNALIKTVLLHWRGKIAHHTSLSVDVDPSTLF